MDAQPQASLPVQLTSFVGRERELAEARELLNRTRLLTLTGPGGSGKTRLAIELVSSVTRDVPDGVFYVALAPLRDPDLLLASIAQTIGLQDAREQSQMDYLVTYFRSRDCLLVLDNFEHLLPAASLVSELLRRTHVLKVLVTTRASLRISGEQEFPVPPLALPDLASMSGLTTIGSAESIKLFVERARAAIPTFSLNDSNALCIAQIAARLDGLPLAIELAASRIKLLPPEDMLPRLEHSLGVLVTGPRDLPGRQQTLRATIAWSYALLGPQAQHLLAACSVFRGGATLERVDSVASAAGLGDHPEILAAVEELLDHNLIRRIQLPIGTRLATLETIREFAAELLSASGQEPNVRNVHAAEFFALAEQGERELRGPGEKDWLDLLDLEHNNIRATMDFYADVDPERALRLALAMRPYWSARGHFTEGRQRLRMLLQRSSGRTPLRARALNAGGWLAVDQGDYVEAAELHAAALCLSRELGDRLGEGLALTHFGRSHIASGHPEDGVDYLDQGMAILHELADPPDLAVGLLYWGLVAIFTGQAETACDRLAEGVARCRDIGFRSLGARAEYLLGLARLERGDLEGARAAIVEALPISLELGDKWVLAQQIGTFAGLAAKTGQAHNALRLAGFQTAFSRAHQFSVPPVIRAKLQTWIQPAAESVGERASELFAEGERLSLGDAIAVALATADAPRAPSHTSDVLTAREQEVARLVATGLTNREIANRLTLSVRTVEVHVDHILTKLNFSTRTQLAAWMHTYSTAPRDT